MIKLAGRHTSSEARTPAVAARDNGSAVRVRIKKRIVLRFENSVL